VDVLQFVCGQNVAAQVTDVGCCRGLLRLSANIVIIIADCSLHVVRIGPIHFQARCHTKQPNLASVSCLFYVIVSFDLLVNVYFYCIRFSFVLPG